MTRTLKLTLAASILWSLTLSGSDWPAFRGPDGNGISPETGLNRDWQEHPPSVVWTVRLSTESYSGPAAADGRVFLLDHQGDQEIVRAFTLETGDDLWEYTYDDTKRALYGYARSTPAVDDGRVYTLSRLGQVHCLQADTGRCLWARDLVQEFGGRRPKWDYSMSPVINGEKLILLPAGKDAAVVALNKVTGETLWQGGGSAVPVYATPVVAEILGQPQCVVLTHQELMGVDREDGRTLWRYPYRTQFGQNAVTPLVIGDGVLVIGVQGIGDAYFELTAEGPKAKWNVNRLQSKFSTPVFYEGHIYGTRTGGQLTCLDPFTGEIKWWQDGFEWGGVVAFEDLLIAVNGQRGDVVLVRMDPSGYEESGRIKPLEGQMWTAPILVDGRLLVRNKLNLACVDLRLPTRTVSMNPPSL